MGLKFFIKQSEVVIINGLLYEREEATTCQRVGVY